MSQGVLLALLVLAALSVLRLTNLPPFSSNTSQSPTPSQALPTPITRSTGFSTGVATAISETTPISPSTTLPPSSSISPPPSSSTPPKTKPQPPVRANW